MEILKVQIPKESNTTQHSTKVIVLHDLPPLLFTQLQQTRSVFQLAVALKPNDTPLYIYLRLPNEGASVFLFVRWAKGISRTPPDSHCCN